jgi:hypothetical protein
MGLHWRARRDGNCNAKNQSAPVAVGRGDDAGHGTKMSRNGGGSMSDTPSTNVHELAERITKLLGVTPDEHTMWQLITMLRRFREAVDAGAHDAYDSARMALDDAGGIASHSG